MCGAVADKSLLVQLFAVLLDAAFDNSAVSFSTAISAAFKVALCAALLARSSCSSSRARDILSVSSLSFRTDSSRVIRIESRISNALSASSICSATDLLSHPLAIIDLPQAIFIWIFSVAVKQCQIFERTPTSKLGSTNSNPAHRLADVRPMFAFVYVNNKAISL